MQISYKAQKGCEAVFVTIPQLKRDSDSNYSVILRSLLKWDPNRELSLRYTITWKGYWNSRLYQSIPKPRSCDSISHISIEVCSAQTVFLLPQKFISERLVSASLPFYSSILQWYTVGQEPLRCMHLTCANSRLLLHSQAFANKGKTAVT